MNDIGPISGAVYLIESVMAAPVLYGIIFSAMLVLWLLMEARSKNHE